MLNLLFSFLHCYVLMIIAQIKLVSSWFLNVNIAECV